MRTVKDPIERKQEIIMAAKTLFEQQGYQNTKIIDITRSIDVAKGTFYHYFTSKEEVLEEIVNVTLDEMVQMATELEHRSLPGLEKIRILMHSDRITEDLTRGTIEHLEMPENRELQELSAVSFIKRMSPFIVRFLEQAHQEGEVGTILHAKERVEMIIAAGHFLIDAGLFPEVGNQQRLFVLWDTFERLFDIPSKPFTKQDANQR